jgi:hypothetical protein
MLGIPPSGEQPGRGLHWKVLGELPMEPSAEASALTFGRLASTRCPLERSVSFQLDVVDERRQWL